MKLPGDGVILCDADAGRVAILNVDVRQLRHDGLPVTSLPELGSYKQHPQGAKRLPTGVADHGVVLVVQTDRREGFDKSLDV